MKNISLFLVISLLCVHGIGAMEGRWQDKKESRKLDWSAIGKKRGVNVEPAEGQTSVKELNKPSLENYRQVTIMFAAGNNWKDIVEEWIKQEPKSLKYSDKYNQTPLHWAAMKGYEDIFDLLVQDKKSNLNAKSKKGWTPLMIAALNGHENIIVKLAKYAADLDTRDNQGKNAFQLACGKGHLGCAKRIQVQLLNAFNVNEQDDSGATALHWAAFNGHDNIIKYLLDGCKADKTIADNKGIRPVHRAVQKGFFELAKLLVDVNTINKHTNDEVENTLLHWVATSNDANAPEFASHLIKLGANVSEVDAIGKTPIHIARTEAMKSVLNTISAE